jgi:hypothetical protein
VNEEAKVQGVDLKAARFGDRSGQSSVFNRQAFTVVDPP